LALKVMGLVAVAVTVALLALVGWRAAAGFAGGALTGAGMLAALVVAVDRLVLPSGESHGPRWPWLLLHVGKLGAAVVVAYLLIVIAGASLWGFAAGYAVALAGLFLHMSSRRAARPALTSDERTTL